MTDADMQELQEYRRQDLLRCMQTISEEHWAAAWHPSLAHDLYLIVFKGVSSYYGMRKISAQSLARMKKLAELTGSWWDESQVPRQRHAIALDEAEKRYGKLLAQEKVMSVAEVRSAYERAAPTDWEHETVTFLDKHWHVYKLKANPAITLQYDEDENAFSLRFGDTTVDFVTPSWRTSGPSVPSA